MLQKLQRGGEAKLGPTRLIIRNTELNNKYKKKMQEEGIIFSFLFFQDLTEEERKNG